MCIKSSLGEGKREIGKGCAMSVRGGIVVTMEFIIPVLDAMDLLTGVLRGIVLLIRSITETDIWIPIVEDCQEGEDR